MGREETAPNASYNDQNAYHPNVAMPSQPEGVYYTYAPQPQPGSLPSYPPVNINPYGTITHNPMMFAMPAGTGEGQPQMQPGMPQPTMPMMFPAQTVIAVPAQQQIDSNDTNGAAFIFLGLLATFTFTPLFALFLLLCFQNPRTLQYIRIGIGIGWIMYSVAFIFTGVAFISSYNESCTMVVNNGIQSANYINMCKVVNEQQKSIGGAFLGFGIFMLLMGFCMIRRSRRTLGAIRKKPTMLGSPSPSPMYQQYMQPVPMPQPVYQGAYVTYLPVDAFQQQQMQQQMQQQGQPQPPYPQNTFVPNMNYPGNGGTIKPDRQRQYSSGSSRQ